MHLQDTTKHDSRYVRQMWTVGYYSFTLVSRARTGYCNRRDRIWGLLRITPPHGQGGWRTLEARLEYVICADSSTPVHNESASTTFLSKPTLGSCSSNRVPAAVPGFYCPEGLLGASTPAAPRESIAAKPFASTLGMSPMSWPMNMVLLLPATPPNICV